MADAPKAGRELDAAIAARVMGWSEVEIRPIANAMGQKVIDEYCGRAPGAPPGTSALVPRYSTMIQYAWDVVEKLRGQFQFVAVISGKGPAGAPAPWVCKINTDGGFFEEKGDTAALAICLAALRAVAPA